MRELWFIFDPGQRGAKLFEQGKQITSKSRTARASTGEVAQVYEELPAEATICVSAGLREENCKQHHRDRYSYENSKRRVKKRCGIIGHYIVDFRCEGEIQGRKEAERADARLRHDETASQHQRCKRDRHRGKVDGKRHQV